MSGIVDWEAYFRGSTPKTYKSASRDLGSADFYVDDENYVIKMDVPGISMEDITITLSKSKRLTIKGTKKSEYIIDEKVSYMCCERAHGVFSRVFNFSDNVPCDATSITAELEDGVLTVTIPLIESESLKTIEIPINYSCKSNVKLTTIDESIEQSNNETKPRRSERNKKSSYSLK